LCSFYVRFFLFKSKNEAFLVSFRFFPQKSTATTRVLFVFLLGEVSRVVTKIIIFQFAHPQQSLFKERERKLLLVQTASKLHHDRETG